MNDQITKQAEKMLKAAADMKLPKDVKEAAMEGLQKTRETYEKLTIAARDAGSVYNGVFAIAHNGSKVLGEKLLDNTEKNSEALFEAAKAVMRCKDMAEVAKVQSDFIQAQLAATQTQAKELYELSSKIGTETAEAAGDATKKAVADMQKVA